MALGFLFFFFYLKICLFHDQLALISVVTGSLTSTTFHQSKSENTVLHEFKIMFLYANLSSETNINREQVHKLVKLFEISHE